MNFNRLKTITAALVLGLGLMTTVNLHADVFGSGANQFTIDFVTVGNPGNANDSTGYGGVVDRFWMGIYEVSEDMITKANNLGNLGITLDARGANKPATGVNWNEAARFVNWLNKSSGYLEAYKFLTQPGDAGYSATNNLVLWSSGDVGYNASNLYRNSNAKYFLPSENEWYKAAYYSGSGTTYFNYATGSDTIPTAVAGGTVSGTAVYGSQDGPTNITVAGGLSPYGTMGQNGNVWEWNESAYDGNNSSSSEARAVRGGYWYGSESLLQSSLRTFDDPLLEASYSGFRVANIPEPSAVWLMIGAGVAWWLKRRRMR